MTLQETISKHDNNSFSDIKKRVYDECLLHLSNLQMEDESKEYGACTFTVNSLVVIGRDAKQTPKKTGQFVTIWKRVDNGPTQPFSASDTFDFFVINTRKGDHSGQFVFPKAALIKHRIVSQPPVRGKLGMRVYPPWELAESKQAMKTQDWQLKFFLHIPERGDVDLQRAKLLYAKTAL
ncbi:MepB family protein [Imperialibacter roseus]|uniref:MepB family protein n=1 Tax=Imperialibacter roseus TaxID=1324217 RepID=A0ABZ0ITU6_9BACT|nr:MepB family protein [Imperialibacter roseus]WOK07116.1 MepB family protein [Imperialibacter roseus]|tara:strand:+ start:24008 stop:24544 length:537 start_codon:yes stop_codon:yes gene_type:complete